MNSFFPSSSSTSPLASFFHARVTRTAFGIAAASALSLIPMSVVAEREAAACGGCFHPQAEVGSSVVTDHRMVVKISTNETILWDQVRYTGSPQEFAWVLPVRDGAKVELSRDAWIQALDATTRTQVNGPERFCNNGGGGGGSSSGGGGGCGSVSMSTLSDNSASGRGTVGADAGFSGNGNVSVLSQSVIGPYQAVTLRAKGGQGIADWLLVNGFAIPANVRPTVDAYTSEGFDFIALRLRPGQGVQAMRPVRVVTPGADATLPLRMVAAGVGAKVGLTLWVIGEGRYRTQNFPNAVVDDSKLVWNGTSSKSNLTDLESEIFASGEGRTWLTETSNPAPISTDIFTANGSFKLSLSATYNSACATRPPEQVPCNEGQLPPADGTPDETQTNDAGAADASAVSDAASDAGIGDGEDDGGSSGTKDSGTTSPPKSCTKLVSGCDGFDDVDVARRGMHGSDIWVTRLRADLPLAALNADLHLEADQQTAVTGVHTTDKFSDPKFDPCAPAGSGNGTSSSSGSGGSGGSSSDDGCGCRTSGPLGSSVGTWLIMALTAVLASKIARRRRRR